MNYHIPLSETEVKCPECGCMASKGEVDVFGMCSGVLDEVQGDIWEFHDKGHWIVIPTNGFVKNNGRAVMGRGLALQASVKFPELSYELGDLLKMRGNIPFQFDKYRIVTFPVKRNWWEKAELLLIKESAEILVKMEFPTEKEVYVPRVGCGNGRLNWEGVKFLLDAYLDDRFIIVSNIDDTIRAYPCIGGI